MNKKASNPGSVVAWTEQVGFTDRRAGARDGATSTPSTAPDNFAGHLRNPKAAILDEVAIHGPRSSNRCFDLSWSVVTLPESACGFRDQRLQRGHVV